MSDEERRERERARQRAGKAAMRAADRDGYNARARAWRASRSEAQREKAGMAARARRLATHERRRAYDRERYRANAERYRAMSRARYAAQREKWIAYARERRAVEPEMIQARKRGYYRANPDKFRNAQHMRRSTSLGGEAATPTAVYERDAGVCYLCGQLVPFEIFQVEHIVPISQGGVHALFNVATACSPCNQRKRAELPPPEKVPPYARAYVQEFRAALGGLERRIARPTL